MNSLIRELQIGLSLILLMQPLYSFQDANLTVKDKADSLQYYISNPEKFKEFFPANFHELELIYGYTETESGTVFGYLYDNSYDHINTYFYKSGINKKGRIRAIINIMKDGEWQADGVAIFQHYSQEFIVNNMLLTVNALNECTENQILGFWHFYYDGPHPKNYKKDYENLYSKVKAIDNRIAELMKQSYEKLLKESDGHGH